MNTTQFYQGLLSELKKQADILPEKKKSDSIMPWVAGLGGAGLAGAGYLGYKHWPAISSYLNIGQDNTIAPEETGALGDYIKQHPFRFAQSFGKGAIRGAGHAAVDNPTQTTLGAGALASKVPGVTKALPFLKGVLGKAFNPALGLDSLYGAIRNPNNLDTGERVGEATTGVAQAGLGTLTAVGSKAAGPWGMAAYALGLVGQGAMSHANNVASQTVDNTGGVADYLGDRIQALQHSDFIDKFFLKRQIANEMKTPEFNEAVNKMTNPGMWARMGMSNYNTEPTMNALQKLRQMIN